MKNQATARFTAQQRMANKAKAERRQAALERRAERLAGVETSVEQTKRLYNNIGR